MKKILLATVLASVSTFAVANPYVQGSIGYSKVQAKADGEKIKDNGVAYQVAVGTTTANIRYALDYTQYNKVNATDSDGEKLTFKANSIGGSAFYDFPSASAFTPYAGARLGYNRLKFTDETDNVSVSKNRVGYGVVAGVAYKINPQLSADVNVQYNNLGTIKWTDDEGEAKVKNTQTGLNVGLRYQF